MSWIKILVINTITTLLLLLVCDFLYSHFYSTADNEKIERQYRVKNALYHHDLKKNYDGSSIWGDTLYRICTNAHGFKSKCGSDTYSHYDIAFIGDSFTEAAGMPYESSFVGMFDQKHPDIRIANLGVGSYSPSIYLRKLQYFLDKGVKFDRVFVFIDISDIQDEGFVYENDDQGNVVFTARHQQTLGNKKPSKLKQFARNNFHLLTILYRAIRYGNTPLTDPVNNPRSEWTYNTKSLSYGELGVHGSIEKSQAKMLALHELLKSKNIPISIGVYPWPGQIANDSLDDNLQVKVWENFCKTRCEYFFNAFPEFNEMVNRHGQQKVIDDYYIKGDVHFNKAGNKKIFDTIENTIN